VKEEEDEERQRMQRRDRWRVEGDEESDITDSERSSGMADVYMQRCRCRTR
jgi:hypothetical protein